ncbi:MAG: recombination protein RecR [Candidatus Azotimanducaceae bacterium]|jgi:recombination protein RecR
MSQNESIIDQLTDALRILPGIGPKSAQRMVFHLLERNRDGARRLAEKLNLVMDQVHHCAACRNFTEDELCAVCRSEKRQNELLCVVEHPGDVSAIEQTGHYRGKYFVLMGTLSPIDGIGPSELGIDELLARCSEGVSEVILAVSSSVEGEATAHYISELIKLRHIQVSRIAQGIPIGGDLELIDGGTLGHAINGRKTI